MERAVGLIHAARPERSAPNAGMDGWARGMEGKDLGGARGGG